MDDLPTGKDDRGYADPDLPWWTSVASRQCGAKQFDPEWCRTVTCTRLPGHRGRHANYGYHAATMEWTDEGETRRWGAYL